MEMEQIVKNIINGDAVLFLGAGFSREAKNNHKNYMKDATEFSKELCREKGYPVIEDLGQVAGVYLGDKKEKEYIQRAQRLITKLQDAFICAPGGYTREQKIVALQDWMRIYTTNYDDVVERICEENGKAVTPVSLKNIQGNMGNQGLVVHLNGLVRNLDVDKLDNEFKLTNRSYLVEDFNKSEAGRIFQNDLKNARTIVFIGTSLQYDLDIQRVVYAIEDIQDKVVFIDRKLKKGEKPNIYEESRKRALGDVKYIGVKGLAEEIDRVSKGYKKNADPITFRSFKQIDAKRFDYREATVQNKWNLLTVGKPDRDIIYSHLADNDYIVQREALKQVRSNIDEKRGRVHILHSNLGNGKTCMMEYLMCKYAGSCHVFEYEKMYQDYEKECQELARLSGHKLLFFENYNLCLEAISILKRYLDASFTLVLSCRTFLNYNMIYRLSEKLGMDVSEFCEYDVNRLSTKDQEAVVGQLQRIKVAEFKDINEKQGAALLRKRGSQWSDIVIYYFNSGLVSDRLDTIYQELAGDSNRLTIVLGCIINNIIGLNLDLNQLFDLLEISQNTVKVTRDPVINEMVGIYDGRLDLKSSILSLYIIRKNGLYQDVIRVMKQMIWNADRLFASDAENIKRQLISISNISELFYKNKFGVDTVNNNELQDYILDYFGEISDVPYHKKNQFFWLQYAMACMDLKRYEMAENHFKLAYKYAKEKGIESYQIDVQYGRYLLEKSCYTGLNADEVFETFRAAHDLWQKVLNNKEAESYYVYKQISVYKNFLERYAGDFNENEFNKASRMVDSFIHNVNRSGRLNIRKSEIEDTVRKLKECKNLLLKGIIHS